MILNSYIHQEKTLHSDIHMKSGLLSCSEFLSYLDSSSKDSPSYIITDENVSSLYAEAVLESLQNDDFKVSLLIVPATEKSKSIACYLEIIQQIISQGVEKKSYIFTVGGGVVNNLGGFLASTIHRGIKLVHFPTTSLAQLDAAIDFKQAVNDVNGKNLIGSFYPAEHIFVDPSTLATLHDRHLYNGLSESIKHALVQDSDFFSYLLASAKLICNRDPDVWQYLTVKTIELKAEIMGNHDEFGMEEMIKQYGHPLGHAFEHLYLDQVFHGEAIAAGMCLTAFIAMRKGYCSESVFDAHLNIFNVFNLPVNFPDELNVEDILRVISFDKHSIDAMPFVAYPSEVGKLYKEGSEYGFFLTQDELRHYYAGFQKLVRPRFAIVS